TGVGEHRGVTGYGRDRQHEVTERHVGLQAAAGADAHDSLDAELDELFHDDRGAGAPHARGLHRDGRALERAGEPEHPALAVDLAGAVEEGLGNVTSAERIAGQEDGLGVVAGLAAKMDWHDLRLYRAGCLGHRSLRPGARYPIIPDMRLREFSSVLLAGLLLLALPALAAATPHPIAKPKTITPIQPASGEASTPPPSPPAAGGPPPAATPPPR